MIFGSFGRFGLKKNSKVWILFIVHQDCLNTNNQSLSGMVLIKQGILDYTRQVDNINPEIFLLEPAKDALSEYFILKRRHISHTTKNRRWKIRAGFSHDEKFVSFLSFQFRNALEAHTKFYINVKFPRAMVLDIDDG